MEEAGEGTSQIKQQHVGFLLGNSQDSGPSIQVNHIVQELSAPHEAFLTSIKFRSNGTSDDPVDGSTNCFARAIS